MKPPPRKGPSGTPRPPRPAASEEATIDPVSGNDATVRPRPSPEQAGGPPELYEFLGPPEGAGELGRLGGYRVLRVLGSGGMGVVFLAEDPQLRRRVALKAMLPGTATPAARQRFLREARAAAAIEHDHIITVYQVGEDRGVPFLAMQLLRGQSLDDRLRREGALPVAEALRIGREAAQGLAAAHARGLIHRDVKPANLWLEEGSGRVKILDFGLARDTRGESQLTQSGAIVGSPAFMSPEQASARPADARSDLFSLGVVLYRLATGELPFKGDTLVSTLMAVASENPPPPRQVNPQVPAPLSDLILELLAKDPGERPASAQKVVQALTALGRGRPARKTASQPAPRRRTAGFLVLLVVLLVMGGGTAAAYFLVPGAPELVGGLLARLRPPDETGPATGPEKGPAKPVVPEWGLLFNGKDRTGWSVANGDDTWKVEDGVLVTDDKGGWLLTERDYKDFDLRLEYWLGEKADSGVGLRMPREGPPTLPGLEIQLMDDASFRPYRKEHHTGALYDVAPPSHYPARSSGEWHYLHVLALGRKLLAEVDTEPALNLDLDAYKNRAAAHPGLQREGGALGLQANGGRAAFRNLNVQPAADPDAGWVSLFGGKDLTGWTPHLRDEGKWEVKDGAIVGSGGKCSLLSDRSDFENFHLRAEVKIGATGSGGVLVRVPFREAKTSLAGYQAHVATGTPYPTGSLEGLVKTSEKPPPPDEWFMLEVIAYGDHLFVKVNGKTTADYVADGKEPSGAAARGHFALHVTTPKTVVQFRKVEVKELPPTKAVP
jgi:hypothetical protein